MPNPKTCLGWLPWFIKSITYSLTKMEPIIWSNGRLRPRPQPQAAPTIIQDLPEITHATQLEPPRKRQRISTSTKYVQYNKDRLMYMTNKAT